MVVEVFVKRLILMVCAGVLLAGSCMTNVTGHVLYRVTGTASCVKLISMWVGNKECQYGQYLSPPWLYRFDAEADLLLGLSASKLDSGTLFLSIFVDGKRLDFDSVPYASIGGTAEVFAQWP
jgi:hypothetical protein